MRFRPQSYQNIRPFLGLRFRVGILICWDSICYSPNAEKTRSSGQSATGLATIWPGGGGSRKGQDRRV